MLLGPFGPVFDRRDLLPRRRSGSQIPAKPKSPLGEMLAFYARESPHLLKSAIEDQFAKLHEERQARERGEEDKELKEQAEQPARASDSTELVLYRCVCGPRAGERGGTQGIYGWPPPEPWRFLERADSNAC